MTTYLTLCNRVLKPFNEVVFTQATFSSATGFHSGVKDWVNQAIRVINQQEIEWPFNYSSKTQILTPEQNTYDYPADVQRVDWESFHLEEDDSLTVSPKHLEAISYDEWNMYHRAEDEQNNSGIRIPNGVVKRPDLKVGITPIPDRAYTITYDYYSFGSELSAYNDEPAIPSRFEDVIVDRALYDAYMFRDNFESARMALERYDRGVAHMRTLLINKYDRVNDTRTGRMTRGYLRLGEE